MYRVYSKEIISKEIFNYNIDSTELETIMGGNIFLDHPELNQEDYIVVQQEHAFEYPTYRVERNVIEEMTLIERYKNGLYELLPHQVEYKGDIITLQQGQYISPEGELITVPKIEGVRIEWNWDTNEWEDVATVLETVQFQYKEYEGMDTPSTVEEMKQEDPVMADEFIKMLIELRGLIYTLNAQDMQPVGYSSIHIPVPSEKLKQFKNRFNKI